MKRRLAIFVLASTALVGLFATVTFYALPIAQSSADYFVLLTAVSALVAIVVVRQLLRYRGLTIHLWAIFIILLMGYYVKLGILALLYRSAAPGLVELAGERGEFLLGNSTVFLASYELTAISFFGFGLAVLVVTGFSSARIPRHSDTGYLDVPRRAAKPRFFLELLGLATFIYTVGATVQLIYGIGVGFLRQEELPFRLAGVLIAVQRYLVPLMFLFVIWGADRGRLVKTSGTAVVLYLLYGITYGLITTSKAGLIFVIASLVGLWVSAGTLSKKRVWLIVGTVLFSVVFSGYISQIRVLRAIPGIPIVETMLAPLVSAPTLVDSAVGQSDMLLSLLAISLRSVGIDALLNIVAFDPPFSLDRLISILIGETSLDQIYGLDVLRLDPQVAVGSFSPSLLGALYILTGGIWAKGFAVFLYTIVWHQVIRLVDRSSLVLKPALLAMLLLSVLFYSSEGTIETMPFTFGLIAIAGLLGEFVVRNLLGKTSYAALRSAPLSGTK
jgi:hypothetical protein